MSTIKRSGLMAMLVVLPACVTINVYFPAAAAEKAADRIIEDVWGQEGTLIPDAVPADSVEPEAQRELSPGNLLHTLVKILVPAAQAAEADLNVSTPAIKKLEKRMQKRFSQLQPHFNSGAVGLTRGGLLETRDLKAVGAKDRNMVKKLVAADNADRKALYREIAVANGHPEWERDIRDTFARRWIANARAGWWYQDGAGKWVQ